jgi:hypothetical protein
VTCYFSKHKPIRALKFTVKITVNHFDFIKVYALRILLRHPDSSKGHFEGVFFHIHFRNKLS